MTGAFANRKRSAPGHIAGARSGGALRFVFYAVMCLMLFSGLANAIKAYYYVFFTQLFVVIASVSLNLWTYVSFSYTQNIDVTKAVKGEGALLKIGIYNDKPFAFTLMRLKVQCVSLRQETELQFNLAPRSDISFEIPLDLPYRGEYQVGMTSLFVQDIFGLCPMRFDMRRLSYYRMLTIKVYPKLHKLPVIRYDALDEKHFNALNLTAAAQGDSYAFVRAYQNGDQATRIHWKLSMRERELFTRQYDIPTQAKTLIAIGSSIDSAALPGEAALFYADTACECAAAIARHSLAAGHPCEIAACGVPGVKSSSLRDFARVYDYLALLPFREGPGVAETLSPFVSGTEAPHAVFAIANSVDNYLKQTLEKAAATGRRIHLILVDPQSPFSADAAPQGTVIAEIRTGQDIPAALEAVL